MLFIVCLLAGLIFTGHSFFLYYWPVKILNVALIPAPFLVDQQAFFFELPRFHKTEMLKNILLKIILKKKIFLTE